MEVAGLGGSGAWAGVGSEDISMALGLLLCDT